MSSAQSVIRKVFTKDRILKAVLSTGFYFLEEGKDVLIEEFGSDYKKKKNGKA